MMLRKTAQRFIWVAALIAGLVVCYRLAVRLYYNTLEITLPCNYDRAFLVVFDSPSGVPLSRRGFHRFGVRVPESGIAHISDQMPGEGGFMEFQERCEGGIRKPTSDEPWTEEIGHRADGDVQFDYICAYPVEKYTERTICIKYLDLVLGQQSDWVE